MQEAPTGALYVWVNDQLGYPRRLAEKLNRTDLVIVSPGQIRFETLVAQSIVVDHATKWTRGMHEAAHYLRSFEGMPRL